MISSLVVTACARILAAASVASVVCCWAALNRVRALSAASRKMSKTLPFAGVSVPRISRSLSVRCSSGCASWPTRRAAEANGDSTLSEAASSSAAKVLGASAAGAAAPVARERARTRRVSTDVVAAAAVSAAAAGAAAGWSDTINCAASDTACWRKSWAASCVPPCSWAGAGAGGLSSMATGSTAAASAMADIIPSGRSEAVVMAVVKASWLVRASRPISNA